MNLQENEMTATTSASARDPVGSDSDTHLKVIIAEENFSLDKRSIT
jgi:hypothetical protein